MYQHTGMVDQQDLVPPSLRGFLAEFPPQMLQNLPVVMLLAVWPGGTSS
jgi:hypothetical protein